MKIVNSCTHTDYQNSVTLFPLKDAIIKLYLYIVNNCCINVENNWDPIYSADSEAVAKGGALGPSQTPTEQFEPQQREVCCMSTAELPSEHHIGYSKPEWTGKYIHKVMKTDHFAVAFLKYYYAC